ncbi:Anaphase-promoting complex subunit 4 [Mortierella claussenii]|nr:Anaphase-promoting complex subunit 4 [Mortierella claussenii]
MPTTTTLDLYSEKQFPASHRLEAWCPTADLLALVSHQNDLDLYRLSWQQHWSIPIKADTVPKGQSSGSMGHPRPGPGSMSMNMSMGGDGQLWRIGAPGGSAHSTGHATAHAVSLAWRPDGKMIAVGLSNGQVNVYDYRDGSLAYSLVSSDSTLSTSAAATKSRMESIHCLKWTDIYLGQPTESAFFGAQYPKSILEALPLLSPVPLSSVQQMMVAARSMFNKNLAMGGGSGPGSAADIKKKAEALAEAVDEPDEESSDIMNVLIAGDNHGRLKLSLFGGFETKPVSVLDLLHSYGIKQFSTLDILQTDIQLDLSELVVIALGSQHCDSDRGNRPDTHLLQITISSVLLEKHSREIRVLGLKKRPVTHLLKYLEEALQVMQAEYRKISQLTEDCVEGIQQALTDNGETATPTYEFLQLLMTGLPSTSMDQYLQQELRRHGLRRWNKQAKAADERFKALRLEEALIYNCIKIVGDFVGLLERLFLVLKVEVKQFSEFENWLERVLEILEPTIRTAEDQPEDGPKKLPPVDYQAVSAYLQSSLTNKGLYGFFQEEDEEKEENRDSEKGPSQPGSDQESINTASVAFAQLSATTGDSNVNKDEEDEDTALGYTSVPSYPIMFSFSEELRSVVRDADLEKDKNSFKGSTLQRTQSRLLPLSSPSSSSTQKKNPFAGAAMAAALAGRGFGLLPSKAPSLFSKPSPPTTSHASVVGKQQQQGEAEKADKKKKSPLSLTLDKHLKLMSRHCQKIFEGPADAVSQSMKITHTIELLASATQSTKHLKLAMRYCYHDVKPWHALALYLEPSASFPEPTLCIVRSSKKPRADHPLRPAIHHLHFPQKQRIASSDSSNRPESPTPLPPPLPPPSQHQLGVSTRSSQKRKASLSDDVSISSSSASGTSRARTKSPSRSATPGTPPPSYHQQPHQRTARHGLDSLAIQSPKPETGADHGLYERMDQEQEESRAQGTTAAAAGGVDNVNTLDLSVIFFSLQEHGWPSEDGDIHPSVLATTTGGHVGGTGTGTDARPFYEILDIRFLDDDTLGVLLNSSPTHNPESWASPNHPPEQFLVTVPLQSPGRFYQPIPLTRPNEPSSEAGMISTCLLDRLLVIPDLAAHAGVPPPLNLYTLPITKSRSVTLPQDNPSVPPSSEATAAGAPLNADNRTAVDLVSDMDPDTTATTVTTTTIDSTAATVGSESGADEELTAMTTATTATTTALPIGFCRIASNERENRRVISVHGPSHPRALLAHGAGRISVFEL